MSNCPCFGDETACEAHLFTILQNNDWLQYLAPVELAIARLLCRETRSASYAAISSVNLRLPVHKDQAAALSPAAELAGFHAKLSHKELRLRVEVVVEPTDNDAYVSGFWVSQDDAALQQKAIASSYTQA